MYIDWMAFGANKFPAILEMNPDPAPRIFSGKNSRNSFFDRLSVVVIECRYFIAPGDILYGYAIDKRPRRETFVDDHDVGPPDMREPPDKGLNHGGLYRIEGHRAAGCNLSGSHAEGAHLA